MCLALSIRVPHGRTNDCSQLWWELPERNHLQKELNFPPAEGSLTRRMERTADRCALHF